MNNDNNTSPKTVLESKVQFSKSKVWDLQEAYFAEQGIAAWLGPVPYYVTSNAVIAHSYAHVACRYLQDSLRQQTIDRQHPIYLLEIGTGCGQFSYLFLHHLDKLLTTLGLQDLPIRYIMSDFSEKNLQYWQKHHQLKPFVDRGWLDFAIYNIHNQTTLTLTESKQTLSAGSVHNPITLIANYVFDTVNHDAFRVTDGQLYEGLISLSTQANNVTDSGKIIELKQLQTHFDFNPITPDYYDNNPALNAVLKHYQQHLSSSTFLIPVGGLRCIDLLRELSGDRVFVITGDKSYTTQNSLLNLGTPHIAFHGSFSMMVNYHAVETYVRALGGDAMMGLDTEGFKISLFALGHTFEKYPETQLAFSESIERFTTKEFLPLKNRMLKQLDKMETADTLALLKLSRWDPNIVNSLNPTLIRLLPVSSTSFQAECRQGLMETYRQYYFMPNNKNLFFLLGYLHLLMRDTDIALERFLESLQHFTADSPTCANIALCYHQQEQWKKAIQYANEAIRLDPTSELAKDIIRHIEDKP